MIITVLYTLLSGGPLYRDCPNETTECLDFMCLWCLVNGTSTVIPSVLIHNIRAEYALLYFAFNAVLFIYLIKKDEKNPQENTRVRDVRDVENQENNEREENLI